MEGLIQFLDQDAPEKNKPRSNRLAHDRVVALPPSLSLSLALSLAYAVIPIHCVWTLILVNQHGVPEAGT